MSSQAAVHSIDAIKDFRVALALYGEETLAALGAVDAEVRRTAHWLQVDRPVFWQEQIKRRRELVSMAKAEVFKRKIAKTENYTPSLAEPLENLRKAEASLQDAERRLNLVRKWQTAFQQVVGEYHGSTRRLKDLAAGDVPRAADLLSRIIDALEAYLRVAPPSGRGPSEPSASGATTAPAELESIARSVLDEQPAAALEEAPAMNDAPPAIGPPTE